MNTSTFSNWREAINYCTNEPGMLFVHHKLTLSYINGLYCIDTTGKSQRFNANEIEDVLNTYYPFLDTSKTSSARPTKVSVVDNNNKPIPNANAVVLDDGKTITKFKVNS